MSMTLAMRSWRREEKRGTVDTSGTEQGRHDIEFGTSEQAEDWKVPLEDFLDLNE